MSLDSQRKQIRQTIRQRRQHLSQAEQHKAAHDLVIQFSQHAAINQAKNIALYLHNDGELSTQKIIDWCWQHNKRVYVPILHPFSHHQLIFTELTPTTPLIKNKYGIAEPKLNVLHIIPYLQLDVVCSPLVAFDLQGNRLGMGGGYYDRTFAQHDVASSNQTVPYLLGLAHTCQQYDGLPIAPWDKPLQGIITPQSTISFSA